MKSNSIHTAKAATYCQTWNWQRKTKVDQNKTINYKAYKKSKLSDNTHDMYSNGRKLLPSLFFLASPVTLKHAMTE